MTGPPTVQIASSDAVNRLTQLDEFANMRAFEKRWEHLPLLMPVTRPLRNRIVGSGEEQPDQLLANP